MPIETWCVDSAASAILRLRGLDADNVAVANFILLSGDMVHLAISFDRVPKRAATITDHFAGIAVNAQEGSVFINLDGVLEKDRIIKRYIGVVGSGAGGVLATVTVGYTKKRYDNLVAMVAEVIYQDSEV